MSVVIVGSCVTRDAFELPGHSHDVLDYVARSSFACSTLGEPFPIAIDSIDPEGEVQSRWQRRMLELDLSRGLLSRLREVQRPSDTLLVVDFIDERFHLYSLNGALATGSVELQRTRIEERLPGITKIHSGTDEHFALWHDGFRNFVAKARSLGMEPIVNRVRWASASTDGTPLRESFDHIAASNAYLERLYAAADALKLRAIDYGNVAFLATSGHRWGLAPFHYVEEVYVRFLDQLDRFADASCAAPRVANGTR
jgi:hypothetical protein